MSEGDTSYLDLLDMLDRYLENEETELAQFAMQTGIKKYESAFRAFRFGLKFVFLTPRKVTMDENGAINLSDVVDARSYCDLFKNHLPFFIALDVAQVDRNDWVVMNMTEKSIFLLIKSSEVNHLTRILDEMRKSKEKALKSGWSGKVFYKVVDSGGQNEL